MNQFKKDSILFFISNMLKTGQKVTESLIYYENEIEEDENVKETLSSLIESIQKGKSLENALHEYGIINDFQKNILITSRDKKAAFERIRKYNKNKNEASKFYSKKLFWFTIINSSLFFLLPYAIDFFNAQMQLIPSTEEKEFSPIIQTVMSFGDYYFYISSTILLFSTFLVFLYIYTYENELELHYKIFKLRGLTDSVIYFEILNDLFKSGLKSHQVFELAGSYMHPESSREYFFDIKEKVVSNKSIDNELRSLAINDFAIFIIRTSIEIGKIKEGFENALISIKDYKKENEHKLRDTIELVVFTINALGGSLFLFFVLLAHIDVTM